MAAPELPRSISADALPSGRQRTDTAGRPKVDNIEQELATDGPDEKTLVKLFKQDVYTVQVYENAKTPQVILSLGRELREGVRRAEEEEEAGVKYRIVGSNYGMFRVEQRTGDLVLTVPPDREQRDTYILRIKVGE